MRYRERKPEHYLFHTEPSLAVGKTFSAKAHTVDLFKLIGPVTEA